VQEVIEWASRTARSDQTFTLYVEHHDLAGWGLIQLAGTDPTIAR
jgi:hypothetical protein